jgi:hypothetical protein
MPVRNLSIAILAGVSFTGAASADSFYVSYLPGGVQTPSGITSNFTTLDQNTPGSNFSYTSKFNNSSYIGTYSGSGSWSAADQYGGAGGTGTYAEVFGGNSFTLSLNKGANYFGLWFSALDSGNLLQFYNDNDLVYSFTPVDFINLVGYCPGTAFCGNPNPQFEGQDTNEQFAYVNLYDENGTFNRIVFSETGAGGFESDNHAVATLSSRPGGTPITATPEPSLFTMTGTALLVLVGVLRRFRYAR